MGESLCDTHRRTLCVLPRNREAVPVDQRSKSGPELIVRTAKERMQILQRFLIVRLVGMRKMGEVLGGSLFPKPEQAELRRTFIER